VKFSKNVINNNLSTNITDGQKDGRTNDIRYVLCVASHGKNNTTSHGPLASNDQPKRSGAPAVNRVFANLPYEWTDYKVLSYTCT